MEENRYLKKYGQNFLNNEYISNVIVDSISFNNQKVLEIGPGDGALTSLLIKKDCDLTCVEIDKFYFDKLQKNYPDLKIINQNALKINFNEYDTIIGNIPYNITSSLFVKIATISEKTKEIVFMTQKEAYERIIECKDKSERCAVSTLMATKYTFKRIINVSKDNFVPKPKVDSTVFKLTQNEDSKITNYRDYYEFLLVIFNSKRKTILNNLIKKYNKDDVIKSVEELGLNITLRPEDLTPDQMVNLYLKLN
jgi:16S rRNA (adenine1518-N6/adenine1519-N6)-dimethyltransferase